MNTITKNSYIPRARAAMNQYRRMGRRTQKRSFLQTLLTQSILCVIVALLCMGIKSIQQPYAQSFQESMKYFLHYSIDFQESVKNIQQAFLNYFPSQQVNQEGEKANETI